MHVNFHDWQVDNIVRYLDKNNIEKCWLLSWEEKDPAIEPIYTPLSINDILKAYRLYPGRIVPFYAPDPRAINIEKQLNLYKDIGVRGCGELKVSYEWHSDEIGKYLEILDKLQLPLIFHMEYMRFHYVPKNDGIFERILNKLLNGGFNGLSRYYLEKICGTSLKLWNGHEYFPGYLWDFLYLENRIKEFPNVTFIGHGPHFWNNLAKYPKLDKYTHQKGKIKELGIIDRLLSYPNFYCDISGKSGYNAMTRKGVKPFLEKHSKKILFGSDNTSLDLQRVLESHGLPEVKLKDIYYNNAKRILK